MSSITYKDIETVVSRAVGPNVKILSHKLDSFSNSKTGILGTHSLLTVDVENESNNAINVKTHTFFVKTPPDWDVVQDLIMDEALFHEEVQFYDELYPRMIESCDCERWAPRCYLTKRDLLVFEDLRIQGYTLRSDLVMDEQSLRLALSALARFHASSIATESRLGKPLREVYPNAFEERMYTTKGKFSTCTPPGYDAMAYMAERFGFNPSLVPKIYDRVTEMVKIATGRCNVVCHSDLWKNNIMYNSSDPTKCILVDFQLLRYTSPVVDFDMLMYINTTPTFRKSSEFDMLEHYYSTLSDTLLQNDSKAEVPSYESILEDYKERRLVGMTYASLYLPSIYMKSERFESLMNNPAALERWFFHDRIVDIRSIMDEDPIYEKKLKAVIGELMEEAQRIFAV